VSASKTLQRRVQWIDTDAAGIYHYSNVVRWAENAEAELHRELGIIDQTFGATPRVAVEFEFRSPLYFDDLVDTTITVARVGETSVTYDIEVRRDDEVAVTGRVVTVFTDRETGAKKPWPEDVRRALEAG
jgi:YbgC/YbaW family acyl-CoA thioester hydrolase